MRLWDGFVEAVGGYDRRRPTAETADCVARLDRDDGSPATLARLYAVESGQPEISRTKREGLAERYGVADGAGQRVLQRPRDARRRARRRGPRADRGAATAPPTRTTRRRGRVGVSRQLAPARRRLDAAMSRGDLAIGIALGLILGGSSR